MDRGPVLEGENSKGGKGATRSLQGNNQILRRTNKQTTFAGPVQSRLHQVSEHAQAARLMHYNNTYTLLLEEPDPSLLLPGHLFIANTVAKSCVVPCIPAC